MESPRVMALTMGSSPRVWGKHLAHASNLGPNRFIPTRVGQTTQAQLQDRAHHGSSPRVWGKHIVNTGGLSPMSRRSLNRLSQPCQHLPDYMASQALRA